VLTRKEKNVAKTTNKQTPTQQTLTNETLKHKTTSG